MGVEADESTHSSLSVSSIDYLVEIGVSDKNISAGGIDNSIYDETQAGALSGESGGNENEFSLDFNFGRRKASGISATLYKVLSVPEYIVLDLFKLPRNNFKWIVDIFDWLWRIALFWAVVAFIRGKL
jgi:hypothetical protein